MYTYTYITYIQVLTYRDVTREAHRTGRDARWAGLAGLAHLSAFSEPSSVVVWIYWVSFPRPQQKLKLDKPQVQYVKPCVGGSNSSEIQCDARAYVEAKCLETLYLQCKVKVCSCTTEEAQSGLSL